MTENCDVFKVESSTINKVGYDMEHGDLYIEFKDGNHYLYQGVSKSEYDNLINAKSVGSYFAEEIRDEYDYQMVGAEPHSIEWQLDKC